MSMTMSPSEVVRKLFLHVRETTQNRGNRVEGIQKFCGGNPGDSWCCYLVTMVLDMVFQGKSPIPRLGAVQDVYDLAKKNKWLTDKPEKDDIFIYVNSADHAHHIGFVTDIPGNGIAGNTSADGKSSNGDRVAEHAVGGSGIRYLRYPR